MNGFDDMALDNDELNDLDLDELNEDAIDEMLKDNFEFNGQLEDVNFNMYPNQKVIGHKRYKQNNNKNNDKYSFPDNFEETNNRNNHRNSSWNSSTSLNNTTNNHRNKSKHVTHRRAPKHKHINSSNQQRLFSNHSNNSFNKFSRNSRNYQKQYTSNMINSRTNSQINNNTYNAYTHFKPRKLPNKRYYKVKPQDKRKVIEPYFKKKKKKNKQKNKRRYNNNNVSEGLRERIKNNSTYKNINNKNIPIPKRNINTNNTNNICFGNNNNINNINNTNIPIPKRNISIINTNNTNNIGNSDSYNNTNNQNVINLIDNNNTNNIISNNETLMFSSINSKKKKKRNVLVPSSGTEHDSDNNNNNNNNNHNNSNKTKHNNLSLNESKQNNSDNNNNNLNAISTNDKLDKLSSIIVSGFKQNNEAIKELSNRIDDIEKKDPCESIIDSTTNECDIIFSDSKISEIKNNIYKWKSMEYVAQCINNQELRYDLIINNKPLSCFPIYTNNIKTNAQKFIDLIEKNESNIFENIITGQDIEKYVSDKNIKHLNTECILVALNPKYEYFFQRLSRDMDVTNFHSDKYPQMNRFEKFKQREMYCFMYNRSQGKTGMKIICGYTNELDKSQLKYCGFLFRMRTTN